MFNLRLINPSLTCNPETTVAQLRSFPRMRESRIALLLLLPMLACSAQAADGNDELLVDPTQPLNLSMAPEALAEGDNGAGLLDLFGVFTSYELSSVLIRAEDRFAVVNGERVRVGDSIGPARVTAIEADHVTLNVNGKVETLELYGSSIKTLVKGDE